MRPCLFVGNCILIVGKNGAAPFAVAKANPVFMLRRTTSLAHSGTGTKTMNTMNTTLWMEKIGETVINAILLAGLPTALVAILVQSF